MIVRVKVPQRMGVHLWELLDSGLYGKTIGEVLERLAAERLQQKIPELRKLGVTQRRPRQ